MSSSGASCFFTLFNLQGARPTSAAGTHSVYHTILLLSSAFFKLFSERSAPKVQIHNSHPAARRSRSELLYDIMFRFACQALFSFCRQPSGASKTMCSFAQPLSRKSLTMLPPFPSPVNTFFHFSSFLFFRPLFLFPMTDIHLIVCPFPGGAIPHLQTLFARLKAERPSSACILACLPSSSSRSRYTVFCIASPKSKKEAADVSLPLRSVLALPIFPGRLQPSIFGAGELNCRVRDGNGWTLTAINTNYFNWLAPIKINCSIIQRSHYAVKRESLEKSGDPCGNRTHVCGVRGRRLSRLTNGP